MKIFNPSRIKSKNLADQFHNYLWIKIGLFLGSCVVAVGLLEMLVRFLAPPSPLTSSLPLRPYIKKEIRVNIPGVSSVGTHSTNRWGMRGDEPPAAWNEYETIITLGGSTTQCFFLDDRKTWPYLLQEKLKEQNLKVWVGNAGFIGQSTRAHLIFIKEVVPKIKPTAVILLTGINDLGLSISKDRPLYDKPYWKFFFFKSRLIQILFVWKSVLFNQVIVVKEEGNGPYQPLPLTGETVKLPEDLRAAVPLLEEYRKNLSEIIRLGRRQNVRIILLTQPMLWEDNDYWRNIQGRFYWIKKTKGVLSAADHWRLLDLYNQELLDVCQEEEVECFDLASVIPRSSLYFYDSAHFTEKGAELVAEEVAEFMLKSSGV